MDFDWIVRLERKGAGKYYKNSYVIKMDGKGEVSNRRI